MANRSNDLLDWGEVLNGCLVVVLFKGRKPRASIKLRSTSTLLVAEVLASVRSEKSYFHDLSVGFSKDLESYTYQHALHSRSYASFLTDCPAREKVPLDQRALARDRSRCNRAIIMIREVS